jgi:hypothetical protein
MYVLFEMMQLLWMSSRHQRRYYYFHYTVRCSVDVAFAAVGPASAYIAILVMQLETLDISPQARENCSSVQNVKSSMMMMRMRQNIDNKIYITMMLMASTSTSRMSCCCVCMSS